jgi:hypothetical protein
MVLTREEQKSVLRMVMESHQGITLSEVKSNQDIREEIKLNLEFYSGLKEVLLSDKKLKEGIKTGIGWLDTVLDIIGGIKDLLTSSDIGKWISEKIKAISNKLFPSLSKNPNDWTDKISNFFKKVAEYLGPKSIAYFIAAFKKRSPKPGEEAIQAEMGKAEKIYKAILVVLIAIAAVKLWIFIAPFFSAATSASASSALLGAVKTAGLGGISSGGFNILGLINKIKHLGHEEGKQAAEDGIQGAIGNLKDELKSISQEKPADSPFGDYYNTEESLRMQKLAGIV